MLRGLVAAVCAASLMAPPQGGSATPSAGAAPTPEDPAPPEAAEADAEPTPAEGEGGWVDVSELEDEPEADTNGSTGDEASDTPTAVPPPTVESAGGLSETPPPKPRNVLGCRGNAGCVKLTAGGMVVSTLAAGTLAGGVVLTLKDDEVLAEDPTRMRTFRPAGEMMLTLGAGFLATGILMLVASRYGDGVRDESTKRRRARRGGGRK